MREQLNLVTAAAEAADRELAERELTRNNDEQVIAERDRACADRDAARLASETANREASITKRQRDEYMSRLAAESARLAQVQQELQQARESEARGARTAASSITAMPSHIEVSTSVGGDTNVVSSTPASCREPPQDVPTQLVYGDSRSSIHQNPNPATSIDHLFAMYDQSSAASPVRQGTSSSSTVAPIPAGRLGSDLGGSSNLFNPARHHERDLGVKPVHLTGTNFTADQAKLFIRYLEQLASTGSSYGGTSCSSQSHVLWTQW